MRSTTEEKIEIMQAFLDGETVEFREYGGAWRVLMTNSPAWSFNQTSYRIKPQPIVKYVVMTSDNNVAGTYPTRERAESACQSRSGRRVVKMIEELED